MEILTEKEKADGWSVLKTDKGFAKVYNPVAAVQNDYERKNAAQKIEALVMTQENVKRLAERIQTLEGIMATISEDVQRLKARKV